MKPAPVKKITWYNQRFPKFNFHWHDYLYYDHWNTSKVFKKSNATFHEMLRPYVGFMKNVHRTYEQKIKTIMTDTIENYFWLLLTDIMKSGDIFELPNHYGWITMVRFHSNDKERWVANFMIIQSEKTNQLKRFPKFSCCNVRNIQLKREMEILVNQHPLRYHTPKSFEDKVSGKQEKLQLLINL